MLLLVVATYQLRRYQKLF